jgi:hypothetical protein
MMNVRVENPWSVYESPETKPVVAAKRPSGETRARLLIPGRGTLCRRRRVESSRSALYDAARTFRRGTKQIPRLFE